MSIPTVSVHIDLACCACLFTDFAAAGEISPRLPARQQACDKKGFRSYVDLWVVFMFITGVLGLTAHAALWSG